MKLVEVLPVAFVAVIAAAALMFDDRNDAEGPTLADKRPVMAQAKWFPVEQSLLPNESVVPAEAVPLALAPAIEPERKPDPRAAKKAAKEAVKREKAQRATAPERVVVAAPRARIEVESRRLGPDERLQLAAMNAITRTPNLSGRIAVQARDSVVHLSGWTMTPGQSLRAEKTVARVEGVRSVVNEIRPRMGATTS